MPDVVTALSSRLSLVLSRFGFGVARQIPTTYAGITDLNVLRQLMPNLEDAAENRPFIEGDHFQDGDAWVGPGPRQGDGQYSEFLQLLEPAFVSKNVMAEGCRRLAGAVIGWEPRWTWVPIRHDVEENPLSDEETAAIQEIESAMTSWWDTRQIHGLLKQMVFKMLWGKECGWRAYVPSGLTDDAGQVNAQDIEDALNLIYVDVPEPEMITVFEHPETKKRLGIVIYVDSTGKERAEICFLDDNDQTVIKLLPTAGGVDSATNDFGGHLTIYAVKLDEALITEQIRSQQKSLNMTLTLLQKGLVDNHFLERMFFNAMPPGHWEMEADGKTRKAFIPAARTTGGKTDSWIQGVDYQDKDGGTVLKDPSVTIRTPLDPNGTIRGAEYWYQVMLESLRQDHILINQLATPSGKSRDHSRGDFVDSAKDPILQTELAGRELMLTVMHMVEAFLGKPGQWTKKFKPIFKCRPNYGPLSVAERQQNIVEAEKGFLSDETVMSLNGTDDVDAEQSLILAQPRRQLAITKLRAEAVTQWSTDFPREVALHLAGFTKKEIKEIMKLVAQANSDDPSALPPRPTPSGGDGLLNDGGGPEIPPKPAPTNGPTRPTGVRSLPPAGNRPSIAANNGNA